MGMMDEKIIDLRNEKKKQDYNNIYEKMYISGDLVEFEEVKLFDDKMGVWLPKSFIDMPNEMAKIKYPNENRPQIIKTDLSSAINFTFSLFDMPITPGQIEGAAKGFKTIIQRIQPSNVFYEEKTEELGETKISWFDFKYSALDNQVYSIMYVTSIENKVMHGIFNCIFEDMQEWKSAANQVMMSIKDLSKK